MSYTFRRRVARKEHHCTHCRVIEPGETYLECTEFPGADAGYADTAGRPVRMAECADCATRYGRAHLLAGAEQ